MGMDGRHVQMVSHGLISGALFLCVGVLYDRMHTRQIADYGGVINTMPISRHSWCCLHSPIPGLPGTSGFVGEYLVIISAFQGELLVFVARSHDAGVERRLLVVARQTSDLWACRQRSRGGPAGPQRSRVPHPGHAGDCRPAGWHLAGAAVEDHAADDSPPWSIKRSPPRSRSETLMPMTDTIMTGPAFSPRSRRSISSRRSAWCCWWMSSRGRSARVLTSTVTLFALAVGAALTVAYDTSHHAVLSTACTLPMSWVMC